MHQYAVRRSSHIGTNIHIDLKKPLFSVAFFIVSLVCSRLLLGLPKHATSDRQAMQGCEPALARSLSLCSSQAKPAIVFLCPAVKPEPILSPTFDAALPSAATNKSVIRGSSKGMASVKQSGAEPGHFSHVTGANCPRMSQRQRCWKESRWRIDGA